ncbi:MAG TPA: PIG-L family deacetylase [Terriglobales bacterium]
MQIAGVEVSPKTILRFSAILLVVAVCFAQAPAPKRASTSSYFDPLPPDTGAAGLKEEMRRLHNTGRLMMVVAHPDDEDGGLLTLESRGKGVHCLLMTLTRGEGGQNETGKTFSDELGVLRTLELLAADRYYGVDQRFSRVADFGYSKTADETFQKWGGHDVPLADIVHVIREFRPDVLMARFSGTTRDGHGHHQASSLLTQEAFRAAGDPKRFPEQLKEGLQPWQPKKLYIGNVCGFGASSCPDENWTVKLNTGEDDPLLGMSYFQFAIEGLRHQQSQGLGDLKFPSGPRYAFYKLADSVLPNTKDASGHEKDLFDGIDTSLPGLAGKFPETQVDLSWLKPELTKVADHIGDSVASLSETVRQLDSLVERLEKSGASDTNSELPQSAAENALAQFLTEKEDQAARALDLSLGLNLEVTVAPPNGPSAQTPAQKDAFLSVSPGQNIELIAKLHNSSKYWINVSSASLERNENWVKRAHAEQRTVGPGEDYYANFLVHIPSDAPISRPYFRRDNPQTESVMEAEPGYLDAPMPPDPLQVRIEYEVGDHRGLHNPAPDFLKKHSNQPRMGWIVGDTSVSFIDDHGQARKLAVAITPGFSLDLEPAERIVPVADGKTLTADVHVQSNLAGTPPGKLHLSLPPAWTAQPATTDVNLAKRGETQDLAFKLFPSALSEGHAKVHAILENGGKEYAEGYTLVTREDLGSMYYFQPAVQHVSVVDVKVPKDLKVGYIMGAGDDIANVLQQIGMSVAPIPADTIASVDLSHYGTIVLGVRAYDTHKDLVENNKKLLDFVSSGGTLVVQNNNSTGDFNSEHLTPYPAELSRARVSVEEAPVQILEPQNPIFHSPNEISEKDFDGWVQERGLYFMSSWDEHFHPLLSCHDPGEADQKGGLLEAKYGKGTYIYTGYAFFRQLPAGVPGAIRLFVNLVDAGHQP